MSAQVDVELPISIQTAGNNLVVVGFNVDLDPSGSNGSFEWPYTILENGSAAPGNGSVTIYADTVTIYSDIVNIGQNISIYSREIVVSPNAVINTSAPDVWLTQPAGSNYLIFNATPNPSPSPTPGSVGPNGAAGGAGCNAGSITLAAQDFSVLQSPPAFTPNPARLFNTGHLLESLFTQMWSSGSAIFDEFQNIPIENFSYTFPTKVFTIGIPIYPYILHIELTFGVEFDNNTLIGAQYCSSITRTMNDADQTITLNLDFGPITISSQNTVITLNGESIESGSCTCSFVLGAALVFTLGSDGVTLAFDAAASATPTIADINLVLDAKNYNSGNPFSLGTDFTSQIAADLTQAVTPAFSTLLPNLGGAFVDAYNGVRQAGGALLTMANGGIGGRGEDGGAGVPNPGGISGNGGNGGASGNGGDGGAITVYAGRVAPDFLLAMAGPGFGGLVALPGNPGDNTANNNGQTYIDGVPGSAGAAGNNGSGGAIMLNGSAYTYLETPPAISYAAFAGQLSTGQLLLEQQGAKLAFISAEVPGNDSATQANYQAVIPLYQWLYNVTEPYVAGNPGNLAAAAVATLQNINSAAGVALSRLVAGLSYYGTPIDWTPATSASAWSTDISNFISYGEILSAAYSAALSAQGNNQAQIAAVQGATNTINAQLAALNSQITALQSSVQSLSTAVTSMNTQIENQVSTISGEITADAESYLQSIGNGCTFDDIVEILKGVYAVGSGIAQAEEDIVGAAESIGEGLQDIYEADENAIANLQTAEANVAALQASWATLQNDLGSNASAGAIAVDADAFESFVSQTFSGYSFEPQLLADMQALVTMVQHRNQARSTLTIQVAQLLKLQAEVAQLSNYAEYVQAMAAKNIEPIQPEYVQFLANNYNYVANCIVDMMWEMNQALQYLTVSPSTLTLNAIDIATLTGSQAQLDTELQQAQENLAHSSAGFSEVTYQIPCGPQTPASSQITATGKLVFNLPTSASSSLFGSAGSVTLSGLTVTLTGLKAANATQIVNVGIGQLGPDARLNVSSETWMSFTHATVTTEYQYVPSTGVVQFHATFASGPNYNGVSPFAYWVLDFSSSVNSWIDWSQVQSIDLGFKGTMVPQPEPVTAGRRQTVDA